MYKTEKNLVEKMKHFPGSVPGRINEKAHSEPASQFLSLELSCASPPQNKPKFAI